MAVWPQLRSPRFALLIATLAFCLVRARDQPGLDISFGSTTATIVPGDVRLAALAVTAVWTILQTGFPPGSGPALAAAAALSLLVPGRAVSTGSPPFLARANIPAVA